MAPFVAVEVDKSTDITNEAQISGVLPHVLGSEVKEAFWGFDDVSDDKRAAAITYYVLSVLDKFSCLWSLKHTVAYL